MSKIFDFNLAIIYVFKKICFLCMSKCVACAVNLTIKTSGLITILLILAIYQYFVLATQQEVLTRKLEQDIIRYKQFCTCTKNFVRTYLNKHQEKKNAY